MNRFSMFPLEDQLILVAQIGVAAVLGGLIGWERDRAGKNAGIRTHVLVCSASAFATGLGELVLSDTAQGDSTRVLHGLLTGIGFIGAGMIWTAKGHGPIGLTSASTIMLVAVIGAACGLGAPFVAVTVTAFALATLMGLTSLDRSGEHEEPTARGSDDDDEDRPDRARTVDRPSVRR